MKREKRRVKSEERRSRPGGGLGGFPRGARHGRGKNRSPFFSFLSSLFSFLGRVKDEVVVDDEEFERLFEDEDEGTGGGGRRVKREKGRGEKMKREKEKGEKK
jgi:hypothetical protein